MHGKFGVHGEFGVHGWLLSVRDPTTRRTFARGRVHVFGVLPPWPSLQRGDGAAGVFCAVRFVLFDMCLFLFGFVTLLFFAGISFAVLCICFIFFLFLYCHVFSAF